MSLRKLKVKSGIPNKFFRMSVSSGKQKSDKKRSTSSDGQDILVPQLLFTSEEDSKEEPNVSALSQNHDIRNSNNKTDYYYEQRGPILRICTSSEKCLKYPRPDNLSSESNQEETYMFDENIVFSVTPQCKDIKFIELKNEGTTAIRYQWFRNPPNHDAIKMLRDLTQYKSLRLSSSTGGGCNDNLNEDKSQEQEKVEIQAVPNELKPQKRLNLEFHFPELPDIILPGQTRNFPIIFRSKTPGYYHEDLYLLTHPRITTEDGSRYAVRLNGICLNVDLAQKGNQMHEDNVLKRHCQDKVLEREAKDIMETVLERSLWDVCGKDTDLLKCDKDDAADDLEDLLLILLESALEHRSVWDAENIFSVESLLHFNE